MITNLNPLERYSTTLDGVSFIVVTRRSDGKQIAFDLVDEGFLVGELSRDSDATARARLEGHALSKKAIQMAKEQPDYVWG